MSTSTPKLYYAVVRGRNPAIYESQEELQRQIQGFKGALHKAFETKEKANDYFDAYSDDQWYAPIPRGPSNTFNASFASNTTETGMAFDQSIDSSRKRPSTYKTNVAKKRTRVYVKQNYVQMPISGFIVQFPPGLSPYPSQKLMIIKMLEAFKGDKEGNGKNALIESPTGSGKTMALLAAACAFLSKYKQEKSEDRENCPKHGSKSAIAAEAKPRRKNGDKTGENRRRSSMQSSARNKGTAEDPLLIHDDDAESTTRNLDDDHCSNFSDQSCDEAEELTYYPTDDEESRMTSGMAEEGNSGGTKKECTCKPRIRIYYGTRTHKQISQVVQEYNRLPCGREGKLRHTILASREQTCINKGIKNPSDAESMKKTLTARCKDLLNEKQGCGFKNALKTQYDNPEGRIKLRRQVETFGEQKVWDLENLVNVLQDLQEPVCPYFTATRVFTSDADIIFCPFNYLLGFFGASDSRISPLLPPDPIIRQSSEVYLKNSIVILDEAHNVEDVCREAASFEFLESDINISIDHLTRKNFDVGKKIEEISGVQQITRPHRNQRKKGEEEVLLLDGPFEDEFDNSEEGAEGHSPTGLTELRKAFETIIGFLEDFRNFFRKFAKEANEIFQETMTREQKEKAIYGSRMFSNNWSKDAELSHTFEWERLNAALEGHEGLLVEPKSKRCQKIRAAIQTLIGKSVAQPSEESSAAAQNAQPIHDSMLDHFRPTIMVLADVEKLLYFSYYFTRDENRKFYKCNIKLVSQSSHRQLSQSTQMLISSTQRFHNRQPRRSSAFSGMDSELFGEDMWLSTSNPPLNLVKAEPFCSGYNAHISFWCMFPSVACVDAFCDSYSVVLASGTLCPADTIKTELGIGFDIQMEGAQVISKERIFASVVPEGPNRQKLQAVYKNIGSGEDNPFMRELAAVVIGTCLSVPKGVLVFVSSYHVLQHLLNALKRSPDWQTLSSTKKVFEEPKRSSELSTVLEEYDNVIANPRREGGPSCNGALMLAVFRGKVSEGIDFTDDKARCVICVGIPFPNTRDELVMQKKRFNDANCGPGQMRILNGDEWYTIQAYRALNQALGRCLRHRMDWGALLLVDERFLLKAKGKDAKKISKWVREQLCAYRNYEQFQDALKSFVNRMSGEEELTGGKENSDDSFVEERSVQQKPFQPVIFR